MIITSTGVLLKVEDSDIKTRNLFITPGVETISGKAFLTVTKPISRVHLPPTVKKIKSNAFAGVNLRYINIPALCRQIEDGAFAGCESLVSVESDGSRDTFVQLGEGAFMGCKNLVSVNLPMKHIPDNAFMGCKKLDMAISTEVETIGSKAFYEAGIKAIMIGKHHKLASIGEYAFGECRRLELVSIDSRCQRNGKKLNIDDLAFSQAGITDVILLGEFSLGEMIFKSCSKLADVDLEGISVIPYGTFEECFHLEALSGAKGIKRIEDFAFCKTQIQKEIFNENVVMKKNSFANLNKRAMRRAVLIS